MIMKWLPSKCFELNMKNRVWPSESKNILKECLNVLNDVKVLFWRTFEQSFLVWALKQSNLPDRPPEWIGMTTGRVWDGSPLSHSRHKTYGYFSSRPKPGVGRGMHSHPYFEVTIKIPSSARPDLDMCYRGGTGLGWARLG